MASQGAKTALLQIKYGIQSLFRQDHEATRYRSRVWYILPVLFSLPGGIVAFLALRYDDPDKAKNCLLLGMIMIAPFILLLGGVAVSEMIVDEIIIDSFD